MLYVSLCTLRVFFYVQTDPSTGTVVYYYTEAKTTHTTTADGTETFDFPSGQVSRQFLRQIGCTIIFPRVRPCKYACVQSFRPVYVCVRMCVFVCVCARELWLCLQLNCSCMRCVIHAQHETHFLDGSKEIQFPDGTVKSVSVDGVHQSLFPDGTSMIEHPDGTKVCVCRCSVRLLTACECPCMFVYV